MSWSPERSQSAASAVSRRLDLEGGSNSSRPSEIHELTALIQQPPYHRERDGDMPITAVYLTYFCSLLKQIHPHIVQIFISTHTERPYPLTHRITAYLLNFSLNAPGGVQVPSSDQYICLTEGMVMSVLEDLLARSFLLALRSVFLS